MNDLTYTTVRIDIETLEALKALAAANLRTPPMQLRAMLLPQAVEQAPVSAYQPTPTASTGQAA